MEVSEWKDENGKPVTFILESYYTFRKNRLLKKSDNLNDIAILADVLVMKALDKDGKKVFKLEDKQTLMEKADPNILQRIAQRWS
nr:MAG: hypothetical protein CM15mV140_150 [Caudoviricetes sp.]